MFKSLLRINPKLSGNVKISCMVTDYIQVDKKSNRNVYDCYIRQAKLYPLSHNLMLYNTPINLLGSSYEYDLKTFFAKYKDSFYTTQNQFNKTDFDLIDKTKNNDIRNTDFEFGCKRISYQKSGCDFAFFAPIWVESVNDIPDYFNLIITFDNGKSLISKTLNIHIKDDGNELNYLNDYLEAYTSKIDSKVYFTDDSTKTGYYKGIDLTRGGFVTAKDSTIYSIFSYQHTINDFDYQLCDGYKRNNIAIRQILPLSFYVNLTEVLEKREIKTFMNGSVKFEGYYYLNGEKVSFYDLLTNYDFLYDNILKYDITQYDMVYQRSTLDIMHTKYPSLYEGEYINYNYSNKIGQTTNRWKLSQSSDEYPYIANVSWAFSQLYKQSATYGRYPSKYNKMISVVDTTDDISDGNMLIIPVQYNKYLADDPLNSLSLYDTFTDIYNNYSFAWFDTINIYNDGEIFFDFDLNKKSINWSTVSENKTMFNGILYDFNTLYNNIGENVKIDNFAIELGIEFQYNTNTNTADYAIKHIYSNYLGNVTFVLNFIQTWKENNIKKIFVLGDDNIRTEDMISNKKYVIDEQGEYINISQFFEGDANKYILVNDLLKILDIYNNDENHHTSLSVDDFTDNIIEGYQYIDITKLANVLYLNEQTNKYESIFKITLSETDDLRDNLYWGSITSLSSNNSASNSALFNSANKGYNVNYKADNITYINQSYCETNTIVYKNSYIHINDIISPNVELNTSDSELIEEVKNKQLSKYNTFNYFPIKSYNSNTIATNVFILCNDSYKDNNYICVQGYNINFNANGDSYIDNINIGKLEKLPKITYNKFYNFEHFNAYIDRLHTGNINLYTKETYLVYDSISGYIVKKYKYTKVTEDFTKITYNNGKFVINGEEKDLYFKEYLYFVNKQLWEHFINSIQTKPYIDLYFYNIELVSNDSELYNFEFSTNIISGEWGGIETAMMPLFTSIYVQDLKNTQMYSYTKLLNNVVERTNEQKYVTYSVNNLSMLYQLSGSEIDMINNNPEEYTFIGDRYTLIDIPNYYLDKVQLNDTNTYKIDDYLFEKYNINVIYEYDGNDLINTYAIYYIHIMIDNTNSTFDLWTTSKITDKEGDTEKTYYIKNQAANAFEKFNGTVVNTINKELYDVLNDNIKNIYPEININFMDIFNDILFKITPALYNVLVHYYPKILQNGSCDILFSKKIIDKLYCYRYLTDLSPIYSKIENNVIPNMYNIGYKSTTDTYLYSGEVKITGDFTLYNEDLNIYKYNGIRCYNKYTEDYYTDEFNRKYEVYYPLEYKHFNDSTGILLSEYLEYCDENKYTYDLLLELETDEKVFDIFKSLIKNYEKFDNDNIQYLLLKYKVIYDTESCGLTDDLSLKLYTLKYIFKLL